MTAQSLSERLEVNIRTIYRDIAALQARRVPIEGAAGIGYVLRRGFDLPPHLVSIGSAKEAKGVDLAELRRAIRENRKLRIRYEDQEGRRSRRVVWPLGMVYYVDAALLGAWCETRRDYRHFRVERILASAVLEEVFPTDGGKLLAGWLALQNGGDFPALNPR